MGKHYSAKGAKVRAALLRRHSIDARCAAEMQRVHEQEASMLIPPQALSLMWGRHIDKEDDLTIFEAPGVFIANVLWGSVASVPDVTELYPPFNDNSRRGRDKHRRRGLSTGRRKRWE
jgi:hypothetical protein